MAANGESATKEEDRGLALAAGLGGLSGEGSGFAMPGVVGGGSGRQSGAGMGGGGGIGQGFWANGIVVAEEGRKAVVLVPELGLFGVRVLAPKNRQWGVADKEGAGRLGGGKVDNGGIGWNCGGDWWFGLFLDEQKNQNFKVLVEHDDANMAKLDGDVLKEFKRYKGILQDIPNKDGACVVKHIIEYEKLGEDSPELFGFGLGGSAVVGWKLDEVVLWLGVDLGRGGAVGMVGGVGGGSGGPHGPIS